jgi:hypothetical protein
VVPSRETARGRARPQISCRIPSDWTNFGAGWKPSNFLRRRGFEILSDKTIARNRLRDARTPDHPRRESGSEPFVSTATQQSFKNSNPCKVTLQFAVCVRLDYDLLLR